jgi:hypothetical protein
MPGTMPEGLNLTLPSMVSPVKDEMGGTSEKIVVARVLKAALQNYQQKRAYTYIKHNSILISVACSNE